MDPSLYHYRYCRCSGHLDSAMAILYLYFIAWYKNESAHPLECSGTFNRLNHPDCDEQLPVSQKTIVRDL